MPIRPRPALPNLGPPADYREALLRSLHGFFSPRWQVTGGRASTQLEIVWHEPAGTFRPARRSLGTGEAIALIEEAFAERGVIRGRALPLRSGRDTDLTISAVQALDPYLKTGQPYTYSLGLITQPVIRLNGRRDTVGQLLPGYLSSFINVSCVTPITAVHQHVHAIDTWISALSNLGLHARHLRIHGTPDIWERGNVRGITLRFTYSGITIGDAVLLWNSAYPTHLASDTGFGLERIRWIQTGQSWAETAFGDHAHDWRPDVLDAVRTAALLIDVGVRPGPRGPAHTLAKLLDRIPRRIATAGLSRLVRDAYMYWETSIRMNGSWPATCQVMEETVLARASHRI